ncbi:TIGR00266 family protein [Synechocystis sp. CS-94]|nr:TIGR00266 family protein [Synechocystis sp. CS-94]
MLYKIRHYPNSVLAVTLKPRERLYVSLGSLISMDRGLVITRIAGGGWLRALARFLLGKDNLMLNAIHNPTDQSLSFTLGKALPGNLTRLNLPKNGIVVSPRVHIAHTSGVNMGVHWLGLSSWWAGHGLLGLKLQGKGRVFLGSYGTLNQLSCPQSFVVEHSHLVAFQPKLKLKVNFPRGIIGDMQSGRGLSSRLQGSGNIYWQSRSLSSLGRFIRLRLR